MQVGGYAQAFENVTIQSLIDDATDGRLGRIASNFVFWSGNASQSEAIPFTLIDTPADSNNFATTIRGLSRPFGGSTAPGSAINFAFPLFATNGFDGTRQAIDVSGDGVQNDGADTSDARDAALAAGIDRINGLAIGGASIEQFYRDNVQGGAGSFTVAVADFDDLDDAILRKLGAEITDTTPVSPD